MEILKYLAINPGCNFSDINGHILQKSSSRKTTSAIYRLLSELISNGYIQKDLPTNSRLLLTKKGWDFLNIQPRNRHLTQIPKENKSIKIFIYIETPWNVNIKKQYHLGVE